MFFEKTLYLPTKTYVVCNVVCVMHLPDDTADWVNREDEGAAVSSSSAIDKDDAGDTATPLFASNVLKKDPVSIADPNFSFRAFAEPCPLTGTV